jgi:hypothetical protein
MSFRCQIDKIVDLDVSFALARLVKAYNVHIETFATYCQCGRVVKAYDLNALGCLSELLLDIIWVRPHRFEPCR